jgi:4-amino-4-deoxy-L-arabinose transferase-like glycosyltransferase
MKLKGSYLITLALLTLFVVFFGIGHNPIIDVNEGLYAEVAREMLTMHQYIVPHLNYVPYIEKPPLLYWLTALSYKLFGISSWSAHLVPALSLLGTSAAICWFSLKSNDKNSAWLATMIFLTGFGTILIARTILFDMLLTFLFSSAAFLFYLWYSKKQVGYLRFAYVFLALAVLCKGFLAMVLAPAIVLLFLLWEKQSWSTMKKLFDWPGLLLFFAIALPWHILAAIKLPGFTWHYVINEQLNRFTNHRFPHDYHTGPFYFYLPRILVYLFPWSLLFLTFLLKRCWQWDSLTKFLLLWLLVPLLFFSIAGDKGDYYMIIAMPALAILLARQLNRMAQYGMRWVKPTCMVLPFICVVPLLFFVYGRAKLNSHFSQQQLAQYVLTHHPKRPVYFYRDYEQISSLLFYLQHRVPIIDTQSQDLYFGKTTPEAKGWFIDDAQFKQAASKQPMYVAVRNKYLTSFEQMASPLKFHVVSSTYHVSLLSND